MKAFVVSYTDENEKLQTMTLYVSEEGKLQEFVDQVLKKGGEVHEIKLAKQQVEMKR